MAKRTVSVRAPARKLRYGWVPDLPDQRDYMYVATFHVPAQLPSAVDLRAQCPPVEDQGNLGSCTANALAGALEFLELKDKKPPVDFSRLFIYYNERALERTIKSDSGAQLRDGIKTLAKQGVCSEKKWPYVVSKFDVKPTPSCYKDAADHQITSYHRIASLDEMRACLADGYPFVLGFTVYESFESQQAAHTGVLNMPQPGEKAVGGHAVTAVGYNDSEKRFTIRNSWGTSWGLQGYFTMPYDYISNHNLARDFWAIRAGE